METIMDNGLDPKEEHHPWVLSLGPPNFLIQDNSCPIYHVHAKCSAPSEQLLISGIK